MSKTLQVDIVSLEKSLYSGQTEMVVVASDQGELGIMADHMPLLARLKPGPVRLMSPGMEQETFWISGGLLEVLPQQVTILADAAERADDLDEAAVLATKEELEKALRDQKVTRDATKLEAQLMRAISQLSVIDTLRRSGRR